MLASYAVEGKARKTNTMAYPFVKYDVILPDAKHILKEVYIRRFNIGSN